MDKKKILITIIVPVYNTEKYLKECLDSIVSQSIEEAFEILVVDDGSKDRSADIIKYYEKKYKGIIRGIYQKNQGQSAARNHALEVATGEYLIFIDSDDYIGKNYIKKLVDVAKETNADMVLCNYTKVDEKGNLLKIYNANYSEGSIRIPSYISCNRIIKRSLMEKYHMRYKEGIICEDIPLMLELEMVADNVQVIQMPDYFYRTNPASTTVTFKKRKLKMSQLPFQAMEECIEFGKQFNKNISEEELEFFICRIWTSLIFDIGRNCERKIRRAMVNEINTFMKKYFPDCYKNPYVKLRRFKNMNFVQRGGTWIFVQGMKFHCLGVISEILSVF